MNWDDAFKLAAAFLVSLGGGGAIVLGLSNWIGRLLADRYVEKLKQEIQQEIESYKTKLRKSEFLFQKEFDAASQFIELRRRLSPRHRFPDMEFHDACEDFACNFTSVEKGLEDYIATHGAALSQGVLDRLSDALAAVAAGKFEVSNGEVSREGAKVSERVMDEMEEVERELRDAVRTQSVT